MDRYIKKKKKELQNISQSCKGRNEAALSCLKACGNSLKRGGGGVLEDII